MTRAPAAVVTVLVDLAPGTAEGARRSVDDYLELAEALWPVPLRMVVFCDAVIAEVVAGRRAACAAGVATIVVPFDLGTAAAEDLATLRRLQEHGPRPRCATNPEKDTAEYLALGRHKPAMLRAAAELLDVETVWWVDAGITHVAEMPHDLADVLADPAVVPAGVVAHLVELSQEPWFAHIGSERTVGHALAATDEWGQHGTPLVLGGVVGVRCDALSTFTAAFEAARREADEAGWAVTDEMVFSLPAVRLAEGVASSPGSYRGALTAVGPRPVVLARTRPEVSFVDLPGAQRPDRAALNPSICRDPDGGFLVNIRHANYRYDSGRYRPLDRSGHIVTDNVLVHLDDDLCVVGVEPLDDGVARAPVPQGTVLGLEDLRLFRHDGRWFGSATVREHDPSMRCRIVVVALEGARVVDAWLVPGPYPNRHEKNWMPFDDDDRIRFAWRVEPPVLVTFDEVTSTAVLSRAVPPLVADAHGRGGAPFVRVDGGWLGVVHDAERSISTWWVGRVEESRRLVDTLLARHDLDDAYRTASSRTSSCCSAARVRRGTERPGRSDLHRRSDLEHAVRR